MKRLYVDITDICIPSNDNNYDELVEFADAIAEQETIDIVMCGECKWGDHYKGIDGNIYCHCTEHLRTGYMLTDFCSLGERKDDDGQR